MLISWANGENSQQTLPKLVNSFVKSSDTSVAVTETFYLANILILSNHIGKAHKLISTLYEYKDEIAPSTPASGNSSTPVLEYFWQTHKDQFARPIGEEHYESILKQNSLTLDEYLAKEQWGQYRESCRTGWMREHLFVAEPEDPHVWRETDDPVMLAMCSRLLAKEENQGVYPSQERMREALAAAMKLYAQPQKSVNRGDNYSLSEDWKSRHSFLLYRRLAIELAVRVGELETASKILSMALRIDWFGRSSGASLQDFLFVPGIYDVLPLLAKGGKESNPIFIEEEDGDTIVEEIISAVELRAENGPRFLLPPREAGWEELLNRLAEGAWKVNSREYVDQGLEFAEEILFPPATEAEIEAVENDVGELPSDFKEMIRISNGYRGGRHFLAGGIAGIQGVFPSVYSMDEVKYHFEARGLKDLGGDDSYTGTILQLEPGTECDSYDHCIILPEMWKANGNESVKDGEYQYWNGACWSGEFNIFNSVRDSIVHEVECIEEMISKGERYDEEYESVE